MDSNRVQPINNNNGPPDHASHNNGYGNGPPPQQQHGYGNQGQPPAYGMQQQHQQHQQQVMMNPQMAQQMHMQQQQGMMMQQQQGMMMQQQMPLPSNCPPGLEYLANINQLIIKQKKEFFEMMTGHETANKYAVKNSMGQHIYTAKESSNFCLRQCCGPQRPFELAIEDTVGKKVIKVIRPYKCMCYHQMLSCCKCCFDEVIVESPPGETVGKVSQVFGGCEAKYQILDANDAVVLIIDGPSYFKCYCPGDDIPFVVKSSDGVHEVGRVSKQWSNLLQELFTDADNFGITFPMDLDVKMKAVVLGACFLIDFMFFEKQGGGGRHHH